MAKNQKSKRTKIEDIPVKEKPVTEKELEKVKGGVQGIPGVDLGLTKKRPDGKDIRTSA